MIQANFLLVIELFYWLFYWCIDEISPLCIILPQMSGYIKYFENGGKSVT